MHIGDWQKKQSMKNRFEAARDMFQYAHDIRATLYGEHDYRALESLNEVAYTYLALKDTVVADSLYRLVYKKAQEGRGDHYRQEEASALNGIAGIQYALASYDDAEKMYREALFLRKEYLGVAHTFTAHTMVGLSGVLHEKGETERAQTLLSNALLIYESAYSNAPNPASGLRITVWL